MSLLERYELMKQAEQETEVSEEEVKVAEERMDILAKYAEVAEEGLKAEFGDDYELEDVENLASMLIENDLEIDDAEVEQFWRCQADDYAHAVEQLEDAEPNIIFVELSRPPEY